METGLPAIVTALLEPFTDPVSRTWWGALLAMVGITAIWLRVQSEPFMGWSKLGQILRSPSSILDVQMLMGRQLLRLLIAGPTVATGWLIATHLVRRLDAWIGVPATPEMHQSMVVALYSLSLFLAWDLSRFVLHMCMHRISLLWRFHQIHHSAEVLTPLTFHRIHPVESLFYDIRGALVTGGMAGVFYWLFRSQAETWVLLGVPTLGFVLNIFAGNLRHSPFWLRFPSWLERWFLSPAQHQLHHSADPVHYDANYGTWLAVWDRMIGRLRISEVRPSRFGIPATERNHGDDLLSAWLGPFLPVRSVAALVLVGMVAAPAQAEDTGAKESEESETPTESEDIEQVDDRLIIYSPDGTPRVAGSAHYLDESQLKRFDFNNIERIVAQIPAISTRTEDGFGLRPNMGIRGANSDRSSKLTLMEDGVLLAPAPYAAPAAYYFPMSARMVGLEVFKGPAAAVHGPHTVGGAINLLTRSVPEGQEGGADLALGLRETVKAHSWYGKSGDRFGFLMEGILLSSDGFKELDGGGETGFHRSELMAKGVFRPSASQVLQLKLGYAHEVSNETYMGLTLEDHQAQPYRRYAASALGLMDWDRTQAELSWTHEVSDAFEVRSVLYHHYLDRSWTKFNGFSSGIDPHNLLQLAPTTGVGAVYLAVLRGDEDTTSDDQRLRIGTNARQFHSYGFQNSARWEAQWGEVSSRMDVGLRLHRDDVGRLHTEYLYDMVGGELVRTEDERITTTDSQAMAQALAAYVQEDLGIGRFHVIPSARLEAVQTSLDRAGEEPDEPISRVNVLPGLGVLAELGSWIDGFLGVHRGYSPVAPGQAEEVEPELSWNYEAGLRMTQGTRHAEIVGFFNDYLNLTGQCSMSGGCGADDLGRQFNGGEVWIYGAEVVVGEKWLLPKQLSLTMDLSYALTQSEFQTAFVSSFPQFNAVDLGDSLPYVAQHQGSFILGVQHPGFEWSAGLSGHSGMLDSAGTWPVSEFDIPPLLLVDSAASVVLGEHLSLYVSGTNLGGSTAISSWRPVGARPVAPRQIMVGVKSRGS